MINTYFKNKEQLTSKMLSLTTELANVNSGSYNVAGIKNVADILKTKFMELNCVAEEISLPIQYEINNAGESEQYSLGPLLRFHARLDAPVKVLLVGHMDTVFEADHKFQQVRAIDSNRISGPGVTDMKGGIVVMLEALRAFEQMPMAKQLGWEVLLTPDEEIGSIGSKPILLERAKVHDVGLLYEPAFTEDGVLAGQRKGSGDYTIVARGKAAHAGRDFSKGKNAVCAMAMLITAINSLNGQREGVTINIGNIHGGAAVNVVPDLCVARMNIRIPHEQDGEWLKGEFNYLVQQVVQQTDVIIELHGDFFKKPKHIVGKTERLYELVKDVGKELNQKISWQPSGGCCDGNNLSAVGLPNVDTLGVRGGCIHSAEEYMMVDSLVERATLSAGVLARLAKIGGIL